MQFTGVAKKTTSIEETIAEDEVAEELIDDEVAEKTIDEEVHEATKPFADDKKCFLCFQKVKIC